MYICDRGYILHLYFIIHLTITSPATGFSKAFPGIKPHLLTLSSNFQIPIYRDILLALGICSVSKKSCSNILKAGPGSAITIVVGGAAESLSARPGTADLTLRRRWVVFIMSVNCASYWWAGVICRLGFIKVAIQHGCVWLPSCCYFVSLSSILEPHLYPYSPLVRMTYVFIWLCDLPNICTQYLHRYTSKCPMKRVPRSMPFKRNFKACSDSLYHYFMVGAC